jgi:hypothetical protein
MNLRDNKLTLLRQLGQESEPISLLDLLQKLEGKNNARSARRWLHELVQSGAVRKIGQKKGTKYLIVGGKKEPTVLAVGLDEIRVRFRAQRRKIIREIILDLKTGQSLKQYVVIEAAKQIPKDAQAAFIQDVQEDLEHIDEIRLAGLGITPDQLAQWLQFKISGSRHTR